ncbi:MAG: hypothetical protein H0W08_17655 [Acidobacteria bacterium]|nr:hypothetical protein [Acidobacteriota bacterium]
MSASRVAAWVIGVAMCGAWLASAAGVTRQARAPRLASRGADVVQFDALAADVQAQAGRLRARLAAAPAPRPVERNPFSFSARPVPPRLADKRHPSPVALTPPVETREPVLELIGIAENTRPEGLVRTAMITGGHDELMMVTAGQRILGRYDVVLVGADAVELKDVQTGGKRRLILR